jgi:hypothetical protein
MNKFIALAVLVITVETIVALSTLGFIVWVIIKVMQHFGII